MKKINYRKILVTILWIIAIAGLGSSLSFVSKSENNIIAKNINITILNNDKFLFLNASDIKKFFSVRNDSILSLPLKTINIRKLEIDLNSHPAIENAEVSRDINGEIKIDVKQRSPVLRIFNKNGESYYIDSESKLMPLNENYSARVIVASGEIFEPYTYRSKFSVNQIKKNKLYSELSILDEIYDVCTYINSDSILSQLIHQININPEKDLELFPAIGNHKIIFGDSQNINEKFNKLKLFYSQGLNKSDSWTKYSAINLKYKNIVVCTKN